MADSRLLEAASEDGDGAEPQAWRTLSPLLGPEPPGDRYWGMGRDGPGSVPGCSSRSAQAEWPTTGQNRRDFGSEFQTRVWGHLGSSPRGIQPVPARAGRAASGEDPGRGIGGKRERENEARDRMASPSIPPKEQRGKQVVAWGGQSEWAQNGSLKTCLRVAALRPVVISDWGLG